LSLIERPFVVVPDEKEFVPAPPHGATRGSRERPRSAAAPPPPTQALLGASDVASAARADAVSRARDDVSALTASAAAATVLSDRRVVSLEVLALAPRASKSARVGFSPAGPSA